MFRCDPPASAMEIGAERKKTLDEMRKKMMRRRKIVIRVFTLANMVNL
jgi:hypothetical protein